jgi:DNA-binding beta-propeller fold protein YncE
MADETGNQSPQPATRQSELLPAILAIALAVASQLAVRDGLALLGLVGYVAAAWLFVTSVRSIFDSAPRRTVPRDTAPRNAMTLDEPASAEAESEPAEMIVSVGRLSFLRQNWRQVTLAEIFAGNIPPARLIALEASGLEIADEIEAETITAAAGAAVPGPEAIKDPPPAVPVLAAAQISTWSAADSPTASPRAVKVTPQGDVLVLDTSLEQIQRFDERGNLLATYRLSGFAGVDVLDLDVSPDGQTLYVVDAASSRLQVITLSRGDPDAGEVSGEFEEE